MFTWWCQSIGCVLNALLSSFFSTNGVPNKPRNLLKCPLNAKVSVSRSSPRDLKLDVLSISMDTTTLCIHYAWESFLTLNKKMIPLWLQFPLQKMMKQWTEERPVELKVLHQMFTPRWDMGTRRYPLRHRTVTTSRHVSSLLVTPWERQGHEVELIHYIVQRNLDNLVSKVQCQRKFFMWSVKNVASKSLEIEMRGKVNLFKYNKFLYNRWLCFLCSNLRLLHTK